MRTLGRIAVGSTLLGIALMSGQGVASAQVTLAVEIRLDRTAPTTGEIVTGVRSVEGVVRAIEGVRRVDLYVMAPGISSHDVDGAVPVDSFVSDVPLNSADFDLHWDSARTAPELVDLVIVARTATRTGSVQVPGVRVERVEQVPAPAAAPAKTTAKSAAVTQPVVARTKAPVAPVARKAPVSAARTASAPAAVAPEGVTQAQAQAFYSSFGQLPYAAGANSASLVRAASVEAAAESSRGAWPFAAAGLVLMVSAAHAQRVVRVAPRATAAI